MAAGDLTNKDNRDALTVGPFIFFRPIPEHIDGVALGISSAEAYIVPSDATYLIFSATEDFYVKKDGTAALITDLTDGSASELNPVGYSVTGGESLSFISAAACLISISVYKRER